MKPLRSILSFLLSYPLIWLIVAYIYWLAATPGAYWLITVSSVDPIMFFLVMNCLVVAVLDVVLEHLPIENKVTQIVLLCFFILTSLPVPVIAITLFSDTAFFPFILTIFGISVFRTFALDKKGWLVKSIGVLSIPIFVLTIFYFEMSAPISETKMLDGYNYYLATVMDVMDDHGHPYQIFYKCNGWGLECENLREIRAMPLPDMHILVDDKSHEVSLIRNTPDSNLPYALAYTFWGQNSRTYWENAGKLENHIYQMSWECNRQLLNGSYRCGVYTFILYECNLDYIGCHALPLKYTLKYNTSAASYLYFSWEANESEHEISLYSGYYGESDRLLIFTYGDHPRCYVLGCEILNGK